MPRTKTTAKDLESMSAVTIVRQTKTKWRQVGELESLVGFQTVPNREVGVSFWSSVSELYVHEYVVFCLWFAK